MARTLVLERPDADAVRGEDWGRLIGRLALGAIFVASGISKLTGFSGLVETVTGLGYPVPTVTAVLSIVFELGGAVLLILGLGTRLGALLLLVFTALATYSVHHFWDLQGEEQVPQQIHFLKNLAICGGLLFVMSAGPGRISLDRLLRRER